MPQLLKVSLFILFYYFFFYIKGFQIFIIHVSSESHICTLLNFYTTLLFGQSYVVCREYQVGSYTQEDQYFWFKEPHFINSSRLKGFVCILWVLCQQLSCLRPYESNGFYHKIDALLLFFVLLYVMILIKLLFKVLLTSGVLDFIFYFFL